MKKKKEKEEEWKKWELTFKRFAYYNSDFKKEQNFISQRRKIKRRPISNSYLKDSGKALWTNGRESVSLLDSQDTV